MALIFFDRIVREAIRDAQKVACPFDEYVKGLKHMLGELREEFELQEHILDTKRREGYSLEHEKKEDDDE